MTVVVWDGVTLAADKQSTSYGLRSTVTKLFRVGTDIVGCSGDPFVCLEVINWLHGSRNPDAFPPAARDKDKAGDILLVDANRKVWLYSHTPYRMRVEDSWVAVGSGRDYALGALAGGCGGAKQAVEIACRFDSNCGMGVDTLELEP